MVCNPLDSFYTNMIDFKVFRNSNIVATIKGLKNVEKGSNKKYIGFYPDADIQVGDILSNPNSSIKYYIVDIDTATYMGEIYQIKAYYKNSQPVNNYENSTVFNINNAQNSIIGNQQSAILNNSNFNIDDLKQLIELYGSNDKQQLYELSSLLKECLDKDDFHKSKFSKFSDLIAKHSWLPLAISQIIAGYIQSH